MESDHFVARCRGLPWSVTVDDIESFFSDCQLAKSAEECIKFVTTPEGRPSGEAYVEFATSEDLDAALLNDRKNIGKRYIEVFRAKYSDMVWNTKRCMESPLERYSDNVVRLRGIPYDCTKEDIAIFFSGLEITPNGILLTMNQQGRKSGEAFVQFVNGATTSLALEKNRQTIGSRYIEIFRSTMNEAMYCQASGATMSGSSRGGGRQGSAPYGPNTGFSRSRPGPYDKRSRPNLMSRPGKNFRGSFYDNDDMPYRDAGYGGNSMLYPGYNFGGFPRRGPCQYIVHMRGLPYRVTKKDIAEWFSSVADPVDISIIYNDAGRPAGEADVLFNTENDAKRAMTKDRQNMQHRYVELFFDGPTSVAKGQPNFSSNMFDRDSAMFGERHGMRSFGGGNFSGARDDGCHMGGGRIPFY